MGAAVMPFDLEKTTHVFRMTESGGVQRVVAVDAGDKEQITMIRQHLEHEAGRFQRGDYSDPAAIHGESMPGLASAAGRRASGFRMRPCPPEQRLRSRPPICVW